MPNWDNKVNHLENLLMNEWEEIPQKKPWRKKKKEERKKTDIEWRLSFGSYWILSNEVKEQWTSLNNSKNNYNNFREQSCFKLRKSWLQSVSISNDCMENALFQTQSHWW